MIRPNLTAFRPAPQLISNAAQALARRAPAVIASLMGNGGLAIWGADHASSSPQIADAFFRKCSRQCSVFARKLAFQSLTRLLSSLVALPRRAVLESFPSQATRQAVIRRKQNIRPCPAPPSTAANLSREDQPSGPASASGTDP